VTLAELNVVGAPAFVATIGWVFEHSRWVAERAADLRPFVSIDALHQAMTSIVMHASVDEQLALLRAHPDLGARAQMTDASRGEQAGAGLDALTAADYARLQQLNTAYRDKFEFPFLFAVTGSDAGQILDALEARLPRTRDDEFVEALRQVSRIARFRLEGLIATHDPRPTT
jgi:2-oxo-4-hydroxy-4-carboxy-5-ureidoimidazoline decarboxylase